MLKVTVVCIGKIKEKFLTQAIDEYLKRLSRFAKVEIKEIISKTNEEKQTIEQIQEKETKLLIQAIPSNSFVICLSPDGKQMSSNEFASQLENIQLTNSNVTFVIGGSYGMSKEIENYSGLKLSFSKMTFPHQLFRVIFLEQLYRAFKINNNETYDK